MACVTTTAKRIIKSRQRHATWTRIAEVMMRLITAPIPEISSEIQVQGLTKEGTSNISVTRTHSQVVLLTKRALSRSEDKVD